VFLLHLPMNVAVELLRNAHDFPFSVWGQRARLNDALALKPAPEPHFCIMANAVNAIPGLFP
jgi:hypothetical protein